MPDDRPALETEEIEITPEMIEAALPILWDYDPRFGNEKDIVCRIYEAMNNNRLF
jgi:hypothetical protein